MNEIDLIAQKYATAVHDKDEQAFLSLYDPGVVIFDMWGTWIYNGREDWAGMVKDWFGSLGDERVGVSFSDAFCIIKDDWATWGAIVRYAGLDKSGAELRAMDSRMSWVLQGGAGAWRIVHEHSSAPADFQTGKVNLRRNGP